MLVFLKFINHMTFLMSIKIRTFRESLHIILEHNKIEAALFEIWAEDIFQMADDM